MGKTARAAAAWRTYKEVNKPGAPPIGARIRAVPRLVRGVAKGDYPHMGRGKLAMMALGVLYIISPIDIIPDFLMLIGVADDFGLLLWLTGSLLGESGRFVQWEDQSRVAPHTERVFPPPGDGATHH
ncbi:DUF1232 domain-containing protein [Sinosporangium siamense]|uniref:DUF1232 domain-containing protein n=1 Tax=Sinosporangium siamense TaxID=1367973 RepID=A0A919RL55_9ACTN|nr:DUF1232 domain-containing protein [Sinosporangium siamense]GII95603.1 hypothetical protein Ssi02_58340 [Sinosporangium siamense]